MLPPEARLLGWAAGGCTFGVAEKGNNMDCVFCKIVDGEIPAVKVLDEELVLAFMDINPSSRGHMLVIPKRHAENIFEISEDDLAAVTSAVKRCANAAKEALRAEGITVLQLNGTASDQLVPHLWVGDTPSSVSTTG